MVSLTRRGVLATGSAALAAGMSRPAFAQGATLRMLGGFDANFVLTREIVRPFIELARERSNGRIQIQFSGPEVVPTFEQMQPVGAGAFQLLFTHPAFHANVTGIGSALDAIAPGPARRRETGVWEAFDRHYARFNLKILAVAQTGDEGFHMLLKRPIDPERGLAGMKIRGTVSYHKLIEALGGAPVVMPPGEIYAALERGVVDGAAFGTFGAVDLRWYEVSRYIARPTFGTANVMIFANLGAFQRMSEADREALLAAGREIENRSVPRFNEISTNELAELQRRGMQISRFGAAHAGRLDQLWRDGVWEVAQRTGREEAERLRAFARERGMTG